MLKSDFTKELIPKINEFFMNLQHNNSLNLISNNGLKKFQIFLNGMLSSLIDDKDEKKDLLNKLKLFEEEKISVLKEKNKLELEILKLKKENQKFELQQTTTNTSQNTNTNDVNRKKIMEVKNNGNYQQQTQFNKESNKEILKENTKLKNVVLDQQNTIFYMKDKESKLIKLLLGVKKRGIDLEEIFQEEVLDSSNKSKSIDIKINPVVDKDMIKKNNEILDNSRNFTLNQENLLKNVKLEIKNGSFILADESSIFFYF